MDTAAVAHDAAGAHAAAARDAGVRDAGAHAAAAHDAGVRDAEGVTGAGTAAGAGTVDVAAGLAALRGREGALAGLVGEPLRAALTGRGDAVLRALFGEPG